MYGKSGRAGSCSEDGRSDADERGAFLDGNFKVAGHTHGELAEVELRVPWCELVAKGVETTEAEPGGFGVLIEGGNGHKAAHREIFEFRELFQQLGQIRGAGGEAGFGFFSAELDFKQDGDGSAEACGGFIEPLGDAERVYGVYCGEDFGGFGGFVRLQMADEVDFRLNLKGLQVGRFLLKLLDTVFAKKKDSGCGGLLYSARGTGLGDGHEFNFCGIASGAATGYVDTVLEALDALAQGEFGGHAR